MVLEERWNEELILPALEKQDAFRRPMFSESSVPDRRPIPVADVQWHLANPISPKEVEKALKDSDESAPGPDRIKLRELKWVPASLLAAYYNLWLVAEHTPAEFSHGETILAHKGGEPENPANFRPITMTSRVTRILHKVLAARLMGAALLDPRQKAFVPVDGCADNTFLLDTIIRGAQRRRKPVCLAFLDAAKAFDCVSHQTLCHSLLRL